MTAAVRPNGLPALRDLPIKFTRRSATPGFEKLVGKSTDLAKHSPHEYASEDGRWIVRSVHHSGYGSTNSGRVRWYASLDGSYFPLRWGGGSYTLTREDAIDAIHRQIAQGVCDGFEVLADMRRKAEAAQRAADLRAANLVKARDLLGRMSGADFLCMTKALAEHVDLDKLARAVESAERASC